MRRYATGLQLILLVCAGTVSGYLWRAALHSQSTVAPTRLRQSQEPTRLFVRPQAAPAHSGGRAQPKRSVRPRIRTRRSSPAATSQVVHSKAELAAVSMPTHRTTPRRPVVQTKPKPSRPTKPSRPKTPNPGPRPSPPAPAPSPPAVVPPPTPPPPTPPPPTPPPPTPPPPTPPSTPVTPTPVVSPPTKQAAPTSSTRPGWGKGDRNHDHTGPPGNSGPPPDPDKGRRNK